MLGSTLTLTIFHEFYCKHTKSQIFQSQIIIIITMDLIWSYDEESSSVYGELIGKNVDIEQLLLIQPSSPRLSEKRFGYVKFQLEEGIHYQVYDTSLDPREVEHKLAYLITSDRYKIVPVKNLKDIQNVSFRCDDNDPLNFNAVRMVSSRALLLSNVILKHTSFHHYQLHLGGPLFTFGGSFSASRVNTLGDDAEEDASLFEHLSKEYQKHGEDDAWSSTLIGNTLLAAASKTPRGKYGWIARWIRTSCRKDGTFLLEHCCAPPSKNNKRAEVWNELGFPLYGIRAIRSALYQYHRQMENGLPKEIYPNNNMIKQQQPWNVYVYDGAFEYLEDMHQVKIFLRFKGVPKGCFLRDPKYMSSVRVRVTEIGGTVTDFTVPLFGEDEDPERDDDDSNEQGKCSRFIVIDLSEKQHGGRGGRNRSTEDDKQKSWKKVKVDTVGSTSILESLDDTRSSKKQQKGESTAAAAVVPNRPTHVKIGKNGKPENPNKNVRVIVEDAVTLITSASTRKFWSSDPAVKHVQVDFDMAALFYPNIVKAPYTWWLEILEQARTDSQINVLQQKLAIDSLIRFSQSSTTTTTTTTTPKLSKTKQLEVETKNRVSAYLTSLPGEPQLDLHVRSYAMRRLVMRDHTSHHLMHLWKMYVQRAGQHAIEPEIVQTYLMDGLVHMEDNAFKRSILHEFTTLTTLQSTFEHLRMPLVEFIHKMKWNTEDHEIILGEEESRQFLLDWANETRAFETWMESRKTIHGIRKRLWEEDELLEKKLLAKYTKKQLPECAQTPFQRACVKLFSK